MHELSIAVSLVELAQEEAERLRARVCVVHLKLGAMAGVVKDALLFSYEVACQDTPLEGSELRVQDMPIVVFCPRCEMKRVLDSGRALCCSECGTPTPDLVGGRELELVALEIEE